MLLPYNRLFEKTGNIREGDLIICTSDIDDLNTKNHIGYLRRGGIEFLNRFSNRLHNLDGAIHSNNGWFLMKRNCIKKFKDNKIGHNIPLVFSKEFREVISYSLKFLLDYETIYYLDASFIDITKRIDTISFLSSHDYKRLEKNEDPWTSTMRQNMRIGRFIRKFTNKDAEVESYVNEYKFCYNIHKSDVSKFKIAMGIEMSKWYLERNYADGGGTLNASCMRHMKSQKRLPIYFQNPEKVRMLYLLNPVGKLIGRALIWRLDDPEGVIFMDRIYTTEDYVEKLFLDYAKRKHLLTRDIVEKEKIPIKVKLTKDYGPPQNNPFMDTFKYFDRKNNCLTNKFENFKAGEFWEYIDQD